MRCSLSLESSLYVVFGTDFVGDPAVRCQITAIRRPTWQGLTGKSCADLVGTIAILGGQFVDDLYDQISLIPNAKVMLLVTLRTPGPFYVFAILMLHGDTTLRLKQLGHYTFTHNRRGVDILRGTQTFQSCAVIARS